MNKKIAIFIDGDNISAKYYKYVIKEVSIYGEILIKKVYGDRTCPNLKKWTTVLANEPSTFCHQPRFKKNATDMKLAIDATKVMYTNLNINTFCIVSSDSDFCTLAHDLRENGKFVLGMGEEKSKSCWQEACDRFVKLESLNCEEPDVLLDKPKHLDNHAPFIRVVPCVKSVINEQKTCISRKQPYQKTATGLKTVKVKVKVNRKMFHKAVVIQRLSNTLPRCSSPTSSTSEVV